MVSRLSLLGALYLSPLALANPGILAAPSGDLISPRVLSCMVDIAANGSPVTEASQTQTMELKKDGQSMTFKLFGDQAEYEILVQYYRSEIEEGQQSVHERIEIAVNDLKKNIQEDYVSSKVKSILFMSELSGTYVDSKKTPVAYDALSIECHPSK